MKDLRAFAVALPLTFLLAGCPLYTGDGDGPPVEECRRSSECDSGEICSGGRCVPDTPPGCTDHTDCADDEVCSAAGSCVPGTRCTDASDCASGELCVDGICTAPDACRTHGDCAPGSYCDAGGTCAPSDTCSDDAGCAGFTDFWCDYRDTCVPRDDGACRDQADCDAAEVCVEGRCRPLDDTCQFDRECAPGTACLNNACTRVCAGDGDCVAGESCQGSFCRPDPTQCTRSSQCATGEHCVEGRCLPDCAAGSTCDTGEYCAEDQFCRPDWSPEPFCTMDSDCRPGRTCLDGVCRIPCGCTSDADCMAAGGSAGTCDIATGTCSNEDEICMRFDSQVPECRLDAASSERLCHATNEVSPDCRVQSDCGPDRDCHDGACRNR